MWTYAIYVDEDKVSDGWFGEIGLQEGIAQVAKIMPPQGEAIIRDVDRVEDGRAMIVAYLKTGHNPKNYGVTVEERIDRQTWGERTLYI